MAKTNIPKVILEAHGLVHHAMRDQNMMGLGNFYTPGDDHWRNTSSTTFDPLRTDPGVPMPVRGLGSGSIQMTPPRLPGAFGLGPNPLRGFGDLEPDSSEPMWSRNVANPPPTTPEAWQNLLGPTSKGCGCDGSGLIGRQGMGTNGPGLAGLGDVNVTVNPAWWYVGGTLVTISAALSAVHGYRRDNSIGSALGWGFMGLIFPIITPAVALAQGFGKRRGISGLGGVRARVRRRIRRRVRRHVRRG